MENKAHAIVAGIFVVVVSLLLLGLAAWLTRDTGVRDRYEISTRETVTGLQPQAAVRYRGVEVGKVSNIGFDARAPGNVLIQLEIDREAPMMKDTFATLSYQGVTGLAFIQLGDEGRGGPRLQPDDAAPPRIPLRPGLLASLEARSEVLLDRLDQVLVRSNRILSDENQQHLSSALKRFDSAAGAADQLAQRLDSTVARRLDPALAEATVTLRSVQKNADEIGRVAAEFGRTAQRLNQKDGPLDRLAEGSQALAHGADTFNAATLPRINRMTEDASRAVRQLGRAASNINDNPQSLIFGGGVARPGPGEPGFVAPGAE